VLQPNPSTTVAVPSLQEEAPAEVPPQIDSPAEPSVENPPVASGSWPRAARSALATWLAACVTYALVTVYAWRIPKDPTPSLHHMFSMWQWQDGGYYTRIVEQGYGWDFSAPAFYPLFPMTSWIVDRIVPGGALIACSIVSAACAYGALMLLFRFVDMEFGTETATRTLLYFAAFPMAFYLYGAYNESMFVLLAIGALYAARRGNWWLAGALTALAGGTRLFGLLMAVPLAYEYLRQCGWKLRRLRWDVLSFAIIPLGLVGYAVYCQLALGNWRAFLDAQDHWERKYGWPGEALARAIGDVILHGPRGADFVPDQSYLLTAFEAVCILGAVILTVLGFVGPWRFRRDQYFLLIATIMPLILITMTMVGWGHWLMSAPRYALEFLAPFVILARIGRNIFADRMYLMLGFALQALMLAAVTLQANFVA